MATDRKQNIELGITRKDFADKERRGVLELETGKAIRGGVESTATVFWIGDHSRQHAFGLAGGGDFSKVVCHNPKVRATQKVIDTQHAEAFTAEAVEALTAAAKAYYANAVGGAI